MTDDAPQAVEADCFRQVKDLGKPVIVIMNVKVSVDSGKSVKLVERDMNRAFDYERIEEIRKQFCKFAEPFGQDWSSVPFVAAHLKSAYEAVKCEKEGDLEKAEFWRRISHIDDLKSLICEEVSVRGKYIRVKTFADIITNPMIETLSGLDWQSRMNESQGRVIADKKRALEKRKESFTKEGKKRIEAFMMRLKTELRTDVATFAEEKTTITTRWQTSSGARSLKKKTLKADARLCLMIWKLKLTASFRRRSARSRVSLNMYQSIRSREVS